MGCRRGNAELRDGHTAYNPAPHLGYELDNQGLSTLVMGLMTILHLRSHPSDLQGHWTSDSGCEERPAESGSYLNTVMNHKKVLLKRNVEMGSFLLLCFFYIRKENLQDVNNKTLQM